MSWALNWFIINGKKNTANMILEDIPDDNKKTCPIYRINFHNR